MTTEDPTVGVVAEYLTRTPCVREFGEARYGTPYPDEALLMAEAALRALDAFERGCEAKLRERLAAAIDAELIGAAPDDPSYNSGRDAGLRIAARIVRERP